jgi:hypothetical protein
LSNCIRDCGVHNAWVLVQTRGAVRYYLVLAIDYGDIMRSHREGIFDLEDIIYEPRLYVVPKELVVFGNLIRESNHLIYYR